MNYDILKLKACTHETTTTRVAWKKRTKSIQC